MTPFSNFYQSCHHLCQTHRTSLCIVTSTVLATWLFNKFWINRKQYVITKSLDGKTVLITGGNTGIGYETAKNLLQGGARVILACRSLERGTKAMNQLLEETGSSVENIRVMECDLCSLNSIRAFVDSYKKQKERLDVLICNAGLGWSSSALTRDGFNAVIQANYLGHFLLTNLLLDKLRQCRPSRIVSVSSDLHKSVRTIDWSDAFTQLRKHNEMDPYAQSKFFQILLAFRLKQDLSAQGINVFACTPGWASTSIQDPIGITLGWLAYLLYCPLNWILKFAFMKTPMTGAQTVVYCAVEPTLEESRDLYFANCSVARSLPLTSDSHSAEHLWKISCNAVALQ